MRTRILDPEGVYRMGQLDRSANGERQTANGKRLPMTLDRGPVSGPPSRVRPTSTVHLDPDLSLLLIQCNQKCTLG
jgi:hypothetical protein